MMQTLVQKHTQLVKKVQVRVERSRKAMQVYHGGLVLEHRGLLEDIRDVWVRDLNVIGIQEVEQVIQQDLNGDHK